VVRHDTDIRIHALEERVRGAESIDAIVEALVTQLREYVEEEPGWHAVIHEMLSAARRNDEIREELANLYRRVRGEMAEVLREKEAEGVVKLRADADSVASVFLSIADGLEVQIASDPGWDSAPTVDAAVAVARFLLGERG
jgi:hypothetical protein